jgi:hypothetical protein
MKHVVVNVVGAGNGRYRYGGVFAQGNQMGFKGRAVRPPTG